MADNFVNKFFHKKTIQTGYTFIVSINNDGDQLSDKFINSPLEIFARTGESFPIKPWHIKSVSIPGITTKSEQQKVGQFVINHQMLELETPILKIAFEEDEDGTIAKFIHWLAKRRMTQDGYYYPLSQSSISSIRVEVYNQALSFKKVYIFYKCNLASSTGLELSYSETNAVGYDVDFSFLWYEVLDNRVVLDE